MQFSIRDQGDLAKLELRLSIITILYALMNKLNYTAWNIFVYQEAIVCILPHLGSIQLSDRHDFFFSKERLQGSSKCNIWPLLPCILQDQPPQGSCPCPPGAQRAAEKLKFSVYRGIFSAFLKDEQSVPS